MKAVTSNHWPDGAFVLVPSHMRKGEMLTGRVLRSDRAYSDSDNHDVALDWDWCIVEIEVTNPLTGQSIKQTSKPVKSTMLRKWFITFEQAKLWEVSA